MNFLFSLFSKLSLIDFIVHNIYNLPLFYVLFMYDKVIIKKIRHRNEIFINMLYKFSSDLEEKILKNELN